MTDGAPSSLFQAVRQERVTDLALLPAARSVPRPLMRGNALLPRAAWVAAKPWVSVAMCRAGRGYTKNVSGCGWGTRKVVQWGIQMIGK